MQQQEHQQHQQHLSAYELERLQKMAANKAKMLEMGVHDARDALLATQRASQQAKAPNKPKAPRNAKPAGPARRSVRNAGKERPDYRGQQELAVFVEPKVRRVRKAERECRAEGGRGGSNSRYPAWHPGIPDAPSTAIEEARAAAEELAGQLTNDGMPSFAKSMTDSMVSKGFWLQAPRELEQHYCADSDITFTTPDTMRPASSFRRTQAHRKEGEAREDAWTVGYLQKKDKKTGIAKGGFGFSKNWKGFAADQFLHPGDAVVIQVTGTFEAVLHIFRAWDYASEASRPAGFEALRFSRAAVVATSETDGDGNGQQQQQGAAAADGVAEDREEEAEDEEEGEEGEESGEEEEQEEEAAAGSAAEDVSGEAEGVADEQAAAGRRSRGSTGAKASQQQVALAAVAAAAAKPVKRTAATGAAAAGSSKKSPGTGGTGPGGSSRGAKRLRDEPAGAATAASGSRKKLKQQKERKQAAKPKQRQKRQQQQKEDDFVVDWILGTKLERGVWLYKVRWLGYAAEYDTWEPADSFGGRNPCSYDWGQLGTNGSIKSIAAPKCVTR